MGRGSTDGDFVKLTPQQRRELSALLRQGALEKWDLGGDGLADLWFENNDDDQSHDWERKEKGMTAGCPICNPGSRAKEEEVVVRRERSRRGNCWSQVEWVESVTIEAGWADDEDARRYQQG